ncbi:hypothetical protein TIFTF001_022238 [Ficus carica]|uniref:cytokinin dehydrogenase n=1 Tax=Ficus carica TaxID=3494 RepID=A0AA88AHG1_FICCA|nr:hypothetical protein TIFTF001_022238 [Ficus carica]
MNPICCPCPRISSVIPPILLTKDVGYKLRDDPEALKLASTDYGHIVREIPSAVLDPSSTSEIVGLIKSSYNLSVPFQIAARGQGHSVRGQAMAQNGVVVSMTALKHHRKGTGILVSGDPSSGYYYADVGGEQLWVDVLHATLEHGLAPVSWTDYLYLTVGGTLSNAGIGGQTFRYGPQISNVYELDVVNGKGEFVTCSVDKNSELFYAVLGGLGQFGIIVRARIALEPAPTRVKWVRMLYSDFSAFSRDQERLITINGRKDKNALDYLEGSLLMNQGDPNNWRSSFFPRVRGGELKLQSQGLWEVPHPWLNLFIPKSQVSDFNDGVFREILLKRNITTGPVLLYPMNRNK